MKFFRRHSKFFVHSSDFRSDSENGRYAKAVSDLLKNQNNFDNFKVNKTYRAILEHVTEAQGSSYLEILRSRNDSMLEAGLRTVLVSDFVGNPIKYSFPGIGIRLSPTTL